MGKEKEVIDLVIDALEDLKGVDIQRLDVRDKTSVTDIMVVCTGTSSRHLKSLAENVVQEAKDAGYPPLGIEGNNGSDWVLVDLGDVVVHIMMAETREFYQLERLWTVDSSND